jgi:hypothetical protein
MGDLRRFRLDVFLSTYHLQTFVETGTARGDSLAYAAERQEFSQLFSCEIEPLLAAGACCRFNDDPRVQIMRTDSGMFMQMVARADLAPCFFWLDAHYPGAGFGLRDYDAAMPETVRLPLGRELEQIRRHRQGRGHAAEQQHGRGDRVRLPRAAEHLFVFFCTFASNNISYIK